jgi:hypothetical protein
MAAALVATALLVSPVVLVTARRARGQHDDPKASKELIRQLRREAGRGVRLGWLARSAATAMLGLIGLVSILAGIGTAVDGNLGGGLLWFAVAAACIVGCAALVRRALQKGGSAGRQ